MIGEEFILLYVRYDNADDLNAIRNQYLRFIGGQSHVQCRKNRSSLISSYEKKLHCEC